MSAMPPFSGEGGDTFRVMVESGATPGTAVVSADPTNRYSGMVWVRGDLGTKELRIDIAGTVYKINLSVA